MIILIQVNFYIIVGNFVQHLCQKFNSTYGTYFPRPEGLRWFKTRKRYGDEKICICNVFFFAFLLLF